MKRTLDQYRCILWDWNGTLIDDLELCREIINQSLAKRSLPTVSSDRYRDIFEFPVINYYRTLGFDLEKESFEDVGMEFIKAYGQRMFEAPLHQGVLDLLDRLQRAGKNQFILSALNEKQLHRIIGHFGLERFFNGVWGLSDSYAHSKTELGRQRLAEAHFEPAETLMIGDTIHDFETAQAMGVDCWLVAAGHNSTARLETCGVPVLPALAKLLTV